MGSPTATRERHGAAWMAERWDGWMPERRRQGDERMPETTSRQGGTNPATHVVHGLAVVQARLSQFVEAPDARGVGNLVRYILEYSFGEGDEWAGGASAASVTVLPDGGIRVADDGGGLPIERDGPGLWSWAPLFVAVNVSHTPAANLYIVNALSRRLIVTTCRDGRVWRQEFSGDEEWTDVEEVERPGNPGLSVTFWPRQDVFGSSLPLEVLAAQLDAFSQDHPRARLALVDQRGDGTGKLLRWGR